MTVNKNTPKECGTFHGVDNKEIGLLLEMINGGTFSGQGVEIVAGLKVKLLDEAARRGLGE